MSETERDQDALRRLLHVVRDRNLDPMEVGAEIVRQSQAHPDMTAEQIFTTISTASN